MSKMIPVKNTTKMPIYVGATMIPAGETVIFPEHQVPDYLREVEQIEEHRTVNPLIVILEGSIKEVTEKLPALSDDQLDEIELLEVANADRAGMAKAIQEERLRRADLTVDGSDDTSGAGTGAEGESSDSTDDETNSEGSDVTE